MFEFAGKMHNPKMHQVQRPKEPGRDKSPPNVFNEKKLPLVKNFVFVELLYRWINI